MAQKCLILELFILALFLVPCLMQAPAKQPPHIIFILADDLGWNDVGFHGSNQIPTPNIDALAYSGCILNKYYTSALCTPSRSALMTGKYPIHTATQHAVIFAAERRGLPLSETIMPQHLKRLGYESHIVGKWNLGHFEKEYLPTNRGFDSHLGYWTGHQDYYDHTAEETGFVGLDMRRNLEPARDLHGQYSTTIFTNESVRIIENHNTSTPLFLYLAHAAVHSGNSYTALRAPEDTVAKYLYINDYNRSRFAAVLHELDKSVGEVTEALKAAGMLENSIIVFSTDNGGGADGYNINAASNWPLRGVKSTLFEGGVRGAALIWSPLLENPGRVSKELFDMSDWLPTLYAAAGGNVDDLEGIDGINQWEVLQKEATTKRTRVLHNIDDIYKIAAIRVNNWKYIEGSTYPTGEWNSWYGPSGRELIFPYSSGKVLDSPAYRSISTITPLVSSDKAKVLRQQATVDCAYYYLSPFKEFFNECKPLEAPCLFDIETDPCERNNLATKYPSILQQMAKELRTENATAIPAPYIIVDPLANPALYDGCNKQNC